MNLFFSKPLQSGVFWCVQQACCSVFILQELFLWPGVPLTCNLLPGSSPHNEGSGKAWSQPCPQQDLPTLSTWLPSSSLFGAL